MSEESDTASPAASSTRPGPELLAERTLTGIFVHLFGVGTGFVLPGIVYLVSEHEFTRANARNAVNWQVFHSVAVLAVFTAFGAVVGVDSALPGGLPPDTGAGLVLMLGAGVYALGLVFALNLAFALVATAKAIFGTAWEYPIVPDTVGWIRSDGGDGTRRLVPIVAYALVAPVVFVQVVRLALGKDVPFWPSFVLTVATVLASPLVAAVLYRDITHLRSRDRPWQPSPAVYLGVPIGVGVLAYLTRAFLLVSENPAGDAVYGFMFGLWIASVTYLYGRHERTGTP